MKDFSTYISEAKYHGKSMHFFVRESDTELEGIYVDAGDQAAAMKKVKDYIKKLKNPGDVQYIGMEVYDRKGRIL